jgi:tetratricopeptide (TPR) repeat protein
MALPATAQIDTDHMMQVGRNALYYEDYVLSIRYFNQVIGAKPHLTEPYFFRGLAKFYLGDYQGAVSDCDAALERNPYMANSYQLRGLCYINLKEYDAAVEDYFQSLYLEPDDPVACGNLALCLLQQKNYERADSLLDASIKRWPKESKNHMLKAKSALAQKDTTAAVTCVEAAMKVSPYDADILAFKAELSLRQEAYEQSEGEFDRAIKIKPGSDANLYIGRALARYYRNNLRGAMADYDAALEIDTDNYYAHLNRGLLRAQVGDDNRAISDFDAVLRKEPDNMIVLFNRAILLGNTGSYKAAIRDISTVLKHYPEFWTGYSYRAQMYRKTGNTKQAELDEFRVLHARMNRRVGISNATHKKTRTKSDMDIEKYQDIVVEDREEETTTYASSYRGRVQNQEVKAVAQPIFVLAFNEILQQVRQAVSYHRLVDDLNRSGALTHRVVLTAHEAPLDEMETAEHRQRVEELTKQLQTRGATADGYFARVLEYAALLETDHAIEDLDKCLELDPKRVLAYFQRAGLKFQERLLVKQAQAGEKEGSTIRMPEDWSSIIADLQRCIDLQPDLIYAYFNLGCVYQEAGRDDEALEAYSRVLKMDDKMAEAYYNRGLVYRKKGQLQQARADLSKAGELGLYTAYSLLKKTSLEASEGGNHKKNDK